MESLDNRVHKILKKNENENAVFIIRKNAGFWIKNYFVITVIDVPSKENYSNIMKLPIGFKPHKHQKNYTAWLEKKFEIIDADRNIAIIRDLEDNNYYTYNYKNKKINTYSIE